MNIRCFANLEVNQDEAVPVIRQFVATLRERAVPAAGAKVELDLSGLSKRAAVTIAEFNPKRTTGVPFAQALDIVEELTALTLARIGSLFFTLQAEGFRWKGAPENCSCSILVLDGKAFQRKQRFSITALIDFQAANPKDQAVAGMLEAVEKASGIKFEVQSAAIRLEPDEPGKATGEQILVSHLAWQDVLETAGEKIRPALSLAGIPRLMSSHESIDARFDPAKLGKSVRVNFAGIVKRWGKRSFPEYRPVESEFSFVKPLTSEIATGFVLDKKPGAFSKNFSISLEVRLTAPVFTALESRPLVFDASMFELFQVGPLPLQWVYFTEADLEEALDGARKLLAGVLPVLEEEVRRSLSTILSRRVDEFEGPRRLSAREAYDLVLPRVRSWAPDAKLQCIQCCPMVVRAGAHTLEFLCCDGGRLSDNGQWRLRFHSSKRHEVCDVRAPHRGRIRQMNSRDNRGRAWPSDAELTIAEGWMDSTAALDVVQSIAAQQQPPVDTKGTALDLRVQGGITRQMQIAWWCNLAERNHAGELRLLQVTVPAHGQAPPSVVIHRFDRMGMPVRP
jgi:hypothetical protein